ncbi:MAG: hypothetical protein ACO3P0_06850, partial [Quisquiliibacterium sp.]
MMKLSGRDDASPWSGLFGRPFRRQLRLFGPMMAACLVATLVLLWLDLSHTALATELARYATGSNLWPIALLLAITILSGVVLIRSYLRDTQQRAADARRQQRQAEKLEQEAKWVNDQNQAAILRL